MGGMKTSLQFFWPTAKLWIINSIKRPYKNLIRFDTFERISLVKVKPWLKIYKERISNIATLEHYWILKTSEKIRYSLGRVKWIHSILKLKEFKICMQLFLFEVNINIHRLNEEYQYQRWKQDFSDFHASDWTSISTSQVSIIRYK